jgi:hypothetical protein
MRRRAVEEMTWFQRLREKLGLLKWCPECKKLTWGWLHGCPWNDTMSPY